MTTRAASELARVPAESASRRPGPDRWSPQEIVGHLIDSASNNHQRFVRAQWTPDLVFPGYDQDAWVDAQRYADAPWPALVSLWRELNLHLARVMAAIPAQVRERKRHPHNLHEIAFRAVPADESVTLDDFMADYVDHLEHHLAQIAVQTETPRPSFAYSAQSRELQDRFDTRRLADRLVEVKVHDRFTAADRDFIESRDMFFLATVDGRGQPTCSYKGGDPGFVTLIDDATLAFPCWDGNGMYLSMGNIGQTGRVGLLFIDFQRSRRMRVDGVAELAQRHPLMERWVGAQLVVVVRAEAIYPNCPRYIHRHELVERSAFVPRAGVPTPVPDWKRTDWACDVLPAGDPAAAVPERPAP